MLNTQLLLMLLSLYAGLLFFVAWRTESRTRGSKHWQALVYSLSLAVYCSSWTFFGAVGKAVNDGWHFVSIYLGPVLVFLFGWPFIRRLLAMCNRNRITSIADLIGSRYGKSQLLAAVVTLVAVMGSLPYIALQLKAVTLAWATVNGVQPGTGSGQHLSSSFVTALLMAWFAVLFGTRVIDGPRRHRGMMTAIAVESVVKLVAFAIIAALAVVITYRIQGAETLSFIWHSLDLTLDTTFITETLLAAIAIICLPRQFHVMAVEHHSPIDGRLSRWLFPVYLTLFSLLVIPVAALGRQLMGEYSSSADTLVLMLPLLNGSEVLTALAFIGGISAATGMVIVSTLTLSVMISNELVVPLWLRRNETPLEHLELGSQLRLVRRVAIFALLLVAWLLESALEGVRGLAELGLISFAAAAQILPAIIGALYWRRGHRIGVLAGLCAGMLIWLYCLLLPALLGPSHLFVVTGPAGIGWLAPTNLFGTGVLPSLTHGVIWSLVCNALLFVVVSRRCAFSPLDLRQSNAFTQLQLPTRRQAIDFEPTEIEVRQLQNLLLPLVGDIRDNRVWQEFERRLGHRLLPRDRAPRFVVAGVEEALAAIIGAASAHRAIDLLKKQKPLALEDFVSLVGGSSRQLRFSQELLYTTLETIPQGISVVDADLKLVAWNSSYEQLFHYPPRLLYVGCPIDRIYQHNAERGYMGDNINVDQTVKRRLNLLRGGQEHRIERRLPDGRIIEIVGLPMRNGGYVTIYTDISETQQILDQLATAKSDLESRVTARTAELQSANSSLQRENKLRAGLERELARVNESKSQFLAAASHDLLQPINAARLFLASLQQRLMEPGDSSAQEDAEHIDSALTSAEMLISSLREIARLDSGKLQPQREHFPLDALLQPLNSEFSMMARQAGLTFRCHSTRLWVYTDKHLLQRVLQNFLSNALRYTRHGRVVIGCRRHAGYLTIEVWDTGSGIAAKDRQRIFEEFERAAPRAESGHQGLGLGLAIASRVSALLGLTLTFDSVLGKGSVFRIAVPPGKQQYGAEVKESPVPSQRLDLSVLCIDNEPEIVIATQSLLEQWGCRVVGAATLGEALARCKDIPDVVLADFHLDGDKNGIGVLQSLSLHWGRSLAAVIISADNSEAVRSLARDAGYLFLSKPVKPAALRSILRSVVRERNT